MNRKIVDLVIICGLIIIMIILIRVYFIYKSDAGQCYLNPLQYGAKKLSESNNGVFMGSGYFLTGTKARIEFTQNDFKVIFPESPYRAYENFSEALESI